MDCVVAQTSARAGAGGEFDQATNCLEEMNLTFRARARSFLAKMICGRLTRLLAIAFRTMMAESGQDLDERLSRSEIKKRSCQRRIKELIGEGLMRARQRNGHRYRQPRAFATVLSVHGLGVGDKYA